MNIFRTPKSVFALLSAAVMLLSLTACGNKNPDTEQQPTTVLSVPEDSSQTAFLGNGLYITDVGNYTGAYMEDGSNEVLANIMMVILKNESESDLQLARFSLEYSDFTANFEVTNLPAGETAVLLEKNRHEYVEETFFRAKVDNVSFFDEPMTVHEDKLKITGNNGEMTVENLTDEVLGEVFIYYKNSASDGLFYGGITYRARLEAGLMPGKSKKVMTKHYYPESCTIIDVKFVPTEE